MALARLKFRRTRWLKVHLWLGLILGVLLSIFGVTGSILVFHAEIDEWLHPQMLTVIPPSQSTYRSLAEIFAAGQQAMPANAKHNFTTYPRNEFAVFKLSFAVSDANAGMENWEVGVDPYTAKITGKTLQRRSDDWLPNTFIGLMFELHYALLIPSEEISAITVGISAALLIINTLTGLIVWWPLTGRWHNALTFKPRAGKARSNYDLHKLSGVYSAFIILPVLFSGIYMVLPQNIVPVLELVSPVTYRYWFQSQPPYPDAPAIGMAQAVNIAVKRYPQGRPHWIYGAPNPTQTYTVCQNGVDAPGSLLQHRCMVIDRYSGKILDLDDPSLATASAGEIFTHWQWPLHSGHAFGWPGRILVFLTGLACPLLYVTGVIRWLQKRRVDKRYQIKCRSY